jgi:hypothetical protein
LFFGNCCAKTNNRSEQWHHDRENLCIDEIKPLIDFSSLELSASIEVLFATESGDVSEDCMSFENVAFFSLDNWDSSNGVSSQMFRSFGLGILHKLMVDLYASQFRGN